MTHEVHRQVVDPSVVRSLRQALSHRIGLVAARLGQAAGRLDGLVSAWSHQNSDVGWSMEQLAPVINETLRARGSQIAQDLDAPLEATLFVASSKQRTGTHGHQDIAYRWDLANCTRYAWTTWVALDACDESAGALRFTDTYRTARPGPPPDFLRADFVDPATTPDWLAGERVASAAPGDVVAFDALTWHASAPFVGEGKRMALAIRWRSVTGWEDSVPVGGPSGSRDFGMYTSGRLLGEAIARACRQPEAQCEVSGEIRRILRDFLHLQGGVLSRLGERACRALEDLALALDLAAEEHARPSAEVWRQVRDVAIPKLLAIADRGDA